MTENKHRLEEALLSFNERETEKEEPSMETCEVIPKMAQILIELWSRWT